MAEHTKGPWIFDVGGEESKLLDIYIYGKRDRVDTWLAAVNACTAAGLPVEALEAGAVAGLVAACRAILPQIENVIALTERAAGMGISMGAKESSTDSLVALRDFVDALAALELDKET